jgi:simple sugar transport system substrate-binding protein
MKSTLRILAAGVSILVALTACSSTGGKPRESGGDMGAGQADTPRFTVAMVTHGPRTTST